MPYLSLGLSPVLKTKTFECDSSIPENQIEDIMFNNIISGHRMLIKKSLLMKFTNGTLMFIMIGGWLFRQHIAIV